MDRRTILKHLPFAAAILAAPAVVSAKMSETPLERVNRLSEELAIALDDYWDGKAHATVFPASSGYGIKMSVTHVEVDKFTRLERHTEGLKKAFAEIYPAKKLNVYNQFKSDGGTIVFVTAEEV